MKRLANSVWHYMGFRSTTFALISFGFLIRIGALIISARLPLVSDAFSYHSMALQLHSNENFSPFWPPALPYFLLSFYNIFGMSEFIGRTSMLLFYLLFSFAIYLLTKELSSARTANLTVLFFSVFPTHIFHSINTLTALPTATYLVGVAYLVIVVKKGIHWLYSILLGVTLALLVLTRASSALLILLIPLYIFIRTKNISATLVPLVVSLAIIFAWVFKAHEMTGRWIMINEANSFNIFIGNNPYTPLYKTWWFGSHGEGEHDVPIAYTEMLMDIRGNPPEFRDRLYLKVALDHVVSRPDLFLIRTANRIRNYFAFDTFAGSTLIRFYSMNKIFGLIVIFMDALFYCAIMAAAIRQMFDLHSTSPQLENITLLLLVGVCYAGPYWISFSHPTYHFPVVPLFSVLAAILVENLVNLGQKEISWSWIPSGRRKYLFVSAGLIFLYVQIEWIFVMRSRI